MDLEKTLLAARVAQKRSAEEVAQAVGVHANTIRYAEAGRTSISLSNFQAWAGVLGFRVVLEAAESTPAEQVRGEVEALASAVAS